MTRHTDDQPEDIAALRATVFIEAANTEAAVLHPQDPGGIDSTERLAFAVRVSRIERNVALQAHYDDLLSKSAVSDDIVAIAEGRRPADDRLRAMTEHVDMLAAEPISARPDDITKLRRAGVCDADIVRLSELVSFIGYRVRTDIGLELLEKAQ